MKGLMTGDRETHYEMRHRACHMDTNVKEAYLKWEGGWPGRFHKKVILARLGA